MYITTRDDWENCELTG